MVTVFINNIFSILPIIARVAVVYFVVKSCIHTVWPPELNQNKLHLPPRLYHQPVPNTAKTYKFP